MFRRAWPRFSVWAASSAPVAGFALQGRLKSSSPIFLHWKCSSSENFRRDSRSSKREHNWRGDWRQTWCSGERYNETETDWRNLLAEFSRKLHVMGIELSPTDDELRNRAGIFFPQSLIRNDVNLLVFLQFLLVAQKSRNRIWVLIHWRKLPNHCRNIRNRVLQLAAH